MKLSQIMEELSQQYKKESYNVEFDDNNKNDSSIFKIGIAKGYDGIMDKIKKLENKNEKLETENGKLKNAIKIFINNECPEDECHDSGDCDLCFKEYFIKLLKLFNK